jgi:chemotaxis protein methyltransferase CheR
MGEERRHQPSEVAPEDGLDVFSLALSPKEYAWIRDFLHERTGILLRDGKQAMVAGRLAKRLRHHGVTSYTEYFQRLQDPDAAETRTVVDLLTTNETYFFREQEHFTLLHELASGQRGRSGSFRVWSAACSSGEEAYSIAMTLDDALGSGRWEVLGTDICAQALERAKEGLYPLSATDRIPEQYLRRYCLRGRDEYQGYLAIRPSLASRVGFHELNLNEPFPDLGTFDIVFLRNVMIYFGDQTKQSLVNRVERLLRPGGHLLVSHSETLNRMRTELVMVRPSVYRVAGGPDQETGR